MQEFVDFYHEKDEREFRALGFSFDIFHRTSSEENKQMARFFFERLKENGFIYSKEVEQAYCENDRRFLPDRFVVGTCPHCGANGIYSDYCEMCGRALHIGELLEPKCITCGRAPSTRKTKHYFLKLSAFSGKLNRWLEENGNLQSEVVNYVTSWIRQGLIDWDITRDMDWGVPVPGEQGMVLYVWFDAPIGYVSSTVAWAKRTGKNWEDYWKGEDARIYHFIGKDIVYHHYLFWPAMLMGVGGGFRLPDYIPTRGYLNLEGRKFSKSKGWFVSLEDFLEEFPPDYLRYYETAVTGYDVQDADFVWRDFQQKINNELVANIGNFINRTLVLIQKRCGGKVPKGETLDEKGKAVIASITARKEKVAELMERIELRAALEEILALSAEFNRFLSETEPWREKEQTKVDAVLHVCLRGVTALAILLEPFLPFSSRKIFEMLKLDEKLLVWENVDKVLLEPGAPLGEVRPLYAKITDEQVEAQEKRLKEHGEIS